MTAGGEKRQFDDGELVPGTRYRIVRLIGRGGMGCVYEVEQIELGRRFVLKALLPEYTARPDLEARMRQEWRALGQLRHPGIVEVTDAGATANGVLFYVMELLVGETLRQKLRRERRFPVGEAIRIVGEILEALAVAHDLGVVHRDVKPANVFLVGGERVKLLDFGIAKLIAGGQTITVRGVMMGTPRFLSPEQARGDPVDARADLYAIGLLLFELTCGRGPFDEDRDPNAMLLAHLSRPAPRLDVFLPGTDPRLVELVARLLAKSPDERPASARAVASALRQLEAPADAAVDAPTTSAARFVPFLDTVAQEPVVFGSARPPVLVTERIEPERWREVEPGEATFADGADGADGGTPTVLRAPVIPDEPAETTLRLDGTPASEPEVTHTSERPRSPTLARSAESRSPKPRVDTTTARERSAIVLAALLAFAGTILGAVVLGLGLWASGLKTGAPAAAASGAGASGAAASAGPH